MTITTGAFDSFGVPQGKRNQFDDLDDVDIAEAEEGNTVILKDGRWVPGPGNEVTVSPTLPTDMGVELWVNPDEDDPGTGGGGVTDHGALTGLTDNDHPQYVLDAGDAMTGPLGISVAGPGGGGATPNLRLERDTAPELHFYKRTQAANQRKWKAYISGVANETGASPASLSFASLADDETAVAFAVIRMLRDGRLQLGADAQNDLEAVTKRQMESPPVGVLGESGNAYVSGMVARSGHVVTMSGYWAFKASGTANAQVSWLIGYVPVGFRPAADAGLTEAVVPGAWWANSAYDFKPCAFKISTNGNLYLIPYETTAYTTAGGSYFTGITYKGA